MFKHVQNALDMKQIVLAGPFYYYVIQEVILVFRNFLLAVFAKALIYLCIYF